MNSYSFETLFNSSLVDAVKTYCTDLTLYLLDTVFCYTETQRKNIVTTVENLPETLYFDGFQWKLLKVFTVILFVNLSVIFIAWKIFGKRICERFMKPATSTAIEELKASVARLKLPKEHTPRI